MNKPLAIALSYLVHPALIPMLGVAFILILSPHYISTSVFLVVMLHVFLGTYFFPLLLAIALKRMGLIRSLSMAEASERKLPYLTAGLCYYITAHSLRDYPLPQAVRGYLMAGVVILAIALVLLSFIKISIHTAGMGAFIMLTGYLSYYYGVDLLAVLTIAILLTGLLASARLYLNAHSPAEVYVGFVVGMLSVSGVFWAIY